MKNNYSNVLQFFLYKFFFFLCVKVDYFVLLESGGGYIKRWEFMNVVYKFIYDHKNAFSYLQCPFPLQMTTANIISGSEQIHIH